MEKIIEILKKLPLEIVKENIMPFTYQVQPKEVLEDIISYYEVKNLLKDYYFNMSKLYDLTSAQERFKIHIAEFLKIYNLKEIRQRSFNYYNKEKKREQNLMNLLYEENHILHRSNQTYQFYEENHILHRSNQTYQFSRFNISLPNLTKTIKNPLILFGFLTKYERFQFLIWINDENSFLNNSLLQNICDYIEKNKL